MAANPIERAFLRTTLRKTAADVIAASMSRMVKTAGRRWLNDSDLIKLCKAARRKKGC